jgi:hypothetical protein
MREITADSALVAYCGLYCGACGAYLKEKCGGCHENAKATWCKIRACCIQNSYATCADCKEFGNPNDCRKFNSLVSKLFGLIFGSDRAACIAQVRAIGLEDHAGDMAANRRQSIKRGR